MKSKITLKLPDWTNEFLAENPQFFSTVEERMSFVLELTRQNILRKTGGPFGAAVFEIKSGRLVSIGVNQVMAQNCSSAHAEVLALMLAQQQVGVYDLGGTDIPDHQLVSSGQMCAMCLGAVCWSGVREVAYGATSEEVEKITGFDEGPTPKPYNEQLEQRGIRVVPDILRAEARDVLQLYVDQGGFVYNARQAE